MKPKIQQLAVLTFLVAAGCRGGGAGSGVGSDRLDRAERSLAAGNPGDVIDLLKNRVDGSIRGEKLLGRAFLETGNTTLARECFTKVTELDPADADAWMQLANSCERDRFFERAIEAYERVLKIQPTDIQAAKRHAFLLTDLHLYSDSVTSLYRAAKLAPADEEIRYKLGVVELERDHNEEAESAFDFVLKKAPSHSAALHGRGVARARLAKNQSNAQKRAELLQSAERDLEETLKLAADDAEPAYNLGWLREEVKHDPAGAESAYREALRRRKLHYNSIVRLAGILASKGEKEQAVQLYQKALSINGDPRAKSLLTKQIEQLIGADAKAKN